MRLACLPVLVLATAGLLPAADGDIVFKSEVSLVRVDAQVIDRQNRAITGLHREDFVLREQGKVQEIRNFASEAMPIDILFLFDVSASMRPHVQRVADAAHEALNVLGADDRIAIMVFDRSTRVRMDFKSREYVLGEMDRLLRQESFNGGTDITRGLLDAARYIGREGRKNARRAIVIITDDATEKERDEAAVNRALVRADAVLSALIAPDAMQGAYGGGGGYPGGGRRGRYPNGGGYPGGSTYPGGGYPGGGYPGGGLGGPLGGIILGPRGGNGPYGGRGPVMQRSHTQSAGTSEIARTSGGDSFPVDDASALEDTLSRLRNRYALHFHLPPDAKPGEQRNIDVTLSEAAMRRYPDAEVRYRRAYLSPGGSGNNDEPTYSSEPTQVTRVPSSPPAAVGSGSDTQAQSQSDDDRPRMRRRPAVNDPSGTRGPSVIPSSSDSSEPAAAPPQQAAPPDTNASPQKGGWRRVDDNGNDVDQKGGFKPVKPTDR